MRLADDFIDRPAEEGARLVALSLLAEGDAAAERLAAGSDAEALHDFRVALRRMRSVLRAFRPWVADALGRRTEKRLRAIARSTNGARDAEVQLAWLAGAGAELGAREKAGVAWLASRLEARRASDPRSHADVLEGYRRVSRKLGSRLSVYRSRLGGADPNGTFASVLAVLLREQLAVLGERLGTVRGAGDREAAHAARIEGKRLRYLLEPLRGNPHADVRGALRRLKRLQDILGELHDAHVLGDELEASSADAAAERARRALAAARARPAGAGSLREALGRNPRAGLLALDRMARSRVESLFELLDAEREAGAVLAVAERVEAVAASLESRAGGEELVTRRYLLSGLPPIAAEVPAVEVAEGWLPGERVRERIRRVRGPQGERYFRALRHGGGRRHVAADEEVRREVFEALWPLTEGRRAERRRHGVPEGGVTWRVDAFVDRPLFLAAVELPAFAGEAPPPPWLEPFVVRDVTDDPDFRGEALAALVPAPVPAPAPPPAAGEEDRDATPAVAGADGNPAGRVAS